MTDISFIKMHGLGNDFVVIDDRNGEIALGIKEARAIANRRIGVGFDQLLILEKPTQMAARRRPVGTEPGVLRRW
jgi:diaminopimelate epimerase